MKIFNSLKFKLMLTMLCLALIPLVVLFIIQYSQLSSTVKHDVETLSLELATNNITTTNTWVENKISQLEEMIKVHPEFTNMDKFQIISTLKYINQSDSEVQTSIVADIDGKSVDDFKGLEGEVKSVADREYFQVMKNTKAATVSDIILDKAKGNQIVVVAVPVLDKNQNFVGGVLSAVDIKSLENTIGKVQFAKTGYATMLSKNGEIVFSPDQNKVGKNYKEYTKSASKSKAFSEEIMVKESGNITYSDDDGVEMVGAYATVPGTGWKVLVTAPSIELYGETHNTQLLASIICFIAILLIILFSMLLANSIVKPIHMVGGMVQEMKNGRLKKRLNLKRNDEIGILAKAMDDFADDLENVVVQTMHKISEGDLNVEIIDKSEEDEIMPALRKTIEAISGLNHEISDLTSAAINGDLEVRGNYEKFSGEYREIIAGVNNTLDKISEPIKEASVVLGEIANGNLKVKVNGNYSGDHAFIKNTLNSTIDNLNIYVNEISNVLKEMASGNLNINIATSFKGDFIQIENSLKQILDSFDRIIKDINSSAKQVYSASKQISNAAQVLSESTTEQASSIEELTAAMNIISEQTNKNAISAGQASEYTLAAKEQAVNGNDQMVVMLSSMEEINKSSHDISKIIKVIDEIAFQTNILALNAAVEAARAGQQGKGFAVVADEVRNLASRSAEAAKETSGLIEESILRVDKGTQIANATATALGKIVDSVYNVTSLIGDIATSSNEQVVGISQVNQGISHISQGMQSNSATAEESAASSEELSSQAEILTEMVSRFKVREQYSSSGGIDDLEPEITQLLKDSDGKKKSKHLKNSQYFGKY